MYSRKTALFSTLLVTAFAITAFASHHEMEPYKLGDEVKPFSLKSVEDETYEMQDALGEEVIVVYFWNCNCPFSRAYENHLIELSNEYKEKKVSFWVIDSNVTNDKQTIQEYAEEHELPYPVLKDPESKIADRFAAERTPEVFVIGMDKKIHYHGAPADAQNPDEAETLYMKAAIDALLEGNEPEMKQTKAFGCTIKRG